MEPLELNRINRMEQALKYILSAASILQNTIDRPGDEDGEDMLAAESDLEKALLIVRTLEE